MAGRIIYNEPSPGFFAAVNANNGNKKVRDDNSYKLYLAGKLKAGKDPKTGKHKFYEMKTQSGKTIDKPMTYAEWKASKQHKDAVKKASEVTTLYNKIKQGTIHAKYKDLSRKVLFNAVLIFHAAAKSGDRITFAQSVEAAKENIAKLEKQAKKEVKKIPVKEVKKAATDAARGRIVKLPTAKGATKEAANRKKCLFNYNAIAKAAREELADDQVLSASDRKLCSKLAKQLKNGKITMAKAKEKARKEVKGKQRKRK